MAAGVAGAQAAAEQHNGQGGGPADQGQEQ
jgi:hypothetical protein